MHFFFDSRRTKNVVRIAISKWHTRDLWRPPRHPLPMKTNGPYAIIKWQNMANERRYGTSPRKNCERKELSRRLFLLINAPAVIILAICRRGTGEATRQQLHKSSSDVIKFLHRHFFRSSRALCVRVYCCCVYLQVLRESSSDTCRITRT